MEAEPVCLQVTVRKWVDMILWHGIMGIMRRKIK